MGHKVFVRAKAVTLAAGRGGTISHFRYAVAAWDNSARWNTRQGGQPSDSLLLHMGKNTPEQKDYIMELDGDGG